MRRDAEPGRRRAALLALLLLVAACGRSRPPARPNVVLVVIDTLRADHLPFHGYALNTAPYLLGLAAEGVAFQSCYSASSYTSPATASILTSLYPFQHGVLKGLIVTLNQQAADPSVRLNRIPEAVTTMAEWLRAGGYRTFAAADNLNIGVAEGFTQGFDRFVTLNNLGADQVNRAVAGWRRELRAGAPYFLYLHYMDPHAPYLAQRPWYRPGTDELREQVARYDSEIRFVDEHLRELAADLSWDEDALVIVTADHGEEFLEHGQTGHGKTLYNEVLRVPLLFWSRALRLPPARPQRTVSTLDILPTLAAMLGVPPPPGLSGASLWPFSAAEPAEPRALFATLLASRPGAADSALRATLWDGWKLIVTDDSRRELYDTRRHPRERINQFGAPGTAELAERLNALYLTFQGRSPRYPQEVSKRAIDPALLQELKTLGYVQ
jgi:arylsulfatase A-like enzyme